MSAKNKKLDRACKSNSTIDSLAKKKKPLGSPRRKVADKPRARGYGARELACRQAGLRENTWSPRSGRSCQSVAKHVRTFQPPSQAPQLTATARMRPSV